MKIDNSTHVVRVELIDIDNDKRSILFERPGSRCHFNKVIRFQGYFIQLRLDWGDVRNGEPTLDADIWTETDKKKSLQRKGNWHHTEKKIDEKVGKMVYTFKFQNLILRLITQKTMAKTFAIDTILIRFAPEAREAFDQLPKEVKHLVRRRAIELSKEKCRDYDIRLEDVIKAKEELELNKSRVKT